MTVEKKARNPNILGWGGLGIGIASLVLAIIACGLPHWQVSSTSLQEVNTGIWRYCMTVSGSLEDCGSISNSTLFTDSQDRMMKGVQAMDLLGIVAMIATVVIATLYLFIFNDKRLFMFIAGGLAIFGGLCFMIAIAIFNQELLINNGNLHAGFALTVLAWICAWSAGTLMIAAGFLAL